MRVLVTGGAGFIGSHIVDQLCAAGHTVAVLDDLSTGTLANLPAGVLLHAVDIRDAKAVSEVFAQEQPEAVCHQAAQLSVSRSVREPVVDAEINCLGLLHVLDAAVQHKCSRVIFASSGGVLYGDVRAPAPESAPANPVSPYGISKWVGERYLEFYARQYNFTAVALRYANVYGPRQSPHGEAGVVAIFCKKFLAGQAACINGDGNYVRDYVYVADVARANVLALTLTNSALLSAGALTSLNIGTGIGTDVNVLEARVRAEISAQKCEQQPQFVVPAPEYGPARPGDLRSNLVDASRAHEILGWRPTVPLSYGLRLTAQWFMAQC
jgi:UDP-glucose 4-epimerase